MKQQILLLRNWFRERKKLSFFLKISFSFSSFLINKTVYRKGNSKQINIFEAAGGNSVVEFPVLNQLENGFTKLLFLCCF